MPSPGLGVYASAFLATALAAGFRADAFFAPAFFATGFFAVFLATVFFAMRGSLHQHSLIGQFTRTGPVRYTGQDSLRQPISQNIHSQRLVATKWRLMSWRSRGPSPVASSSRQAM